MSDEKYPRDEKGRFLPGVYQPNRIPDGEGGREQGQAMALKRWEDWYQRAAETALAEVQKMGYDVGPSNLPAHDKVFGIFMSLLTVQLFKHLGNQALEPSQFRDLERMSHLWLKNMGRHPDQQEAKIAAKVDVRTSGPTIIMTGETMASVNAQMEQIRQRDTIDTDAEEVQDDSEDADEVDS